MTQETPPPPKAGYPAQLAELLGKKFPCPHCEQSFTLQDLRQDGTKKSKTWILGTATWGTKEPQMCDLFIIKCPTCGDPYQMIITSRAQSIAALAKKVESSKEPPAKTPTTKAPPPKALPPEKKQTPPRRHERKKFDPKLER